MSVCSKAGIIEIAYLKYPILRGRDIKRYSYKWADLWLIGTFPALKLDINEYLSLKKYLISFMPRIDQSGKKGCRKKTSNKWFETQDNIAYWRDFDRQKIVYPNMASEFIAYYDMSNFFTNQKCFIITSKNINLKYLLAFLNSKLNFYYFKQIGARLGKSGYEMSKIFVERLPIPSINEMDTKIVNLIIDKINKILEQKSNNNQSKNLEKEIDLLIYNIYDLSKEEIKIIEN